MNTNAMSASAIDWATFSASCVRIDSEIDLPHPAATVFDYVTTPALWHTWHPATAEVRNVPNRPLRSGETMLEVIAMLGRRDEALWTVHACQPHMRWEIVTDTPRGSAHITYVLTPIAGGCHFHRTLEYRSKGLPWRWLDASLLRWVLKRQSAQALKNLHAALA